MKPTTFKLNADEDRAKSANDARRIPSPAQTAQHTKKHQISCADTTEPGGAQRAAPSEGAHKSHRAVDGAPRRTFTPPVRQPVVAVSTPKETRRLASAGTTTRGSQIQAPRQRSFLPARFETADQVAWRRQQLVGQLYRSITPAAQHLGAIIAACASATPCGSGACPACQRRVRFHLLRDAHRQLRGRRLLRLSWIPADGRVSVGQLATFDLAKFLASRQRALQRALPEVTIAFGGADVSLNTFDNAEAEWQVHIYVILVACDTNDLRERVRKHCRGEPTAARPYQYDPVVEVAGALSYAIKAIIGRRSGYVDGTGRRNTRLQRLGAAQAAEAALYQHRWPMTRRLLLRGLRIVYRAEGPTLVLPKHIAQSASFVAVTGAVELNDACNSCKTPKAGR